YVAGSNVRFNARFSERNPAAGGLWNPVNTYQWTISGAQGTVAGPIGVNRATDPSGAYSFSAQTPGWYTVVLRTHHLNQAPSDPVPVYDETKYAFLVVPTAAEAGNAAFDAALNSTQQDLDVGSQPEPLPILNYRAVGTVSGGLAPFTYIWNYPNDGKTMEGEPDFITITSPAPTANRTTTLNAEFTKSGTKRIYLTVRDATYREVHKPITYIITNSAEGITPFSPTLDVAATPSPLSISMVEANNQPLTLTLPAGLSAQPQTFVFRATASNGKPPYVFQWTPTGLAPDVPCTKEASFEQCTYRFSSFGPHSVAVTVTDDTSPVQSVTFTQNIMLLSAGEEDSPDGSGGTGDNAAGGSGTGGSGTGGTDSGTGGTGDAGGTAASGTLDPRASNYGLSSAFTRVGLGQDDDLKGSIANIINIVLGFLGIIAVIIVLAGGFKIMTAAGDEDKVSSGKQIITAGVIGLAVILAAWGIAEFVVGNLVSATT
ncbi:MAG: pilin, partial [bacterium]|nr:pilin [bacterium]